uniref:Fe/B12 periplasmic-binding domain-containing protein n=1 Tax=Loa loa TaxID=7209 RepID=A0A1I7VAH7_LOALO
MHDGFAPDISFMHDNSAPEGIKIVNISSAADVRYFFNVPYGVGKAAVAMKYFFTWRTERVEQLERSGYREPVDK